MSKPKYPGNLLERERLYTRMESALSKGDLIIQAPSGYGKSVLVSRFLDVNPRKYIWINAYQTSLPNILRQIEHSAEDQGLVLPSLKSLLTSSQIASEKVLLSEFVHDLCHLREHPVLIIDDIHLAEPGIIGLLISETKKSCGKKVQFILISRTETGIQNEWNDLFAFNKIGLKDLKFTKEEFQDYLSIQNNRSKEASNYSDGWIIGIRLSLSPGKGDQKIINSALNSFSEGERKAICFLSRIDNFSSDMVAEALEMPELISRLQVSPLILVEFDDGLYKFHDYVKESLESSAHKIEGSNLSELYKACAEFYSRKDEPGKAYQFARKSGDHQLLTITFEAYRLDCFNHSSVQKLKELLSDIPEQLKFSEEDTKLQQAWLYLLSGDPLKMIHTVLSINSTKIRHNYISEYWALMAYSYYIQKDFKSTFDAVKKIDALHSENDYVIGYRHIFFLGSLQATGKEREAFSKGLEALSLAKSDTVKGHILLVLCYVARFEAHAEKLHEYAGALLKLSQESGNLEGEVNALSFLGDYYYLRTDYKKAYKHLQRAEDLKNHTIGPFRIGIIALYALSLARIGRSKKALDFIEKNIQENILAGNEFMLGYLQAVRIELEFIDRKNYPRGNSWLDSAQIDPTLTMSESFSDAVTKGRVMVSVAETKNDLKHASGYINEMIAALEPVYNKRYLAECYLLKACIEQKKNSLKANTFFQRATSLLNQTDYSEVYRIYKELSPKLSLIGIENGTKDDQILLSNREKQVAKLYEQNLTDKELAAELGISLATIKRHNANIFNKLQVSSKRHAALILKNK